MINKRKSRYRSSRVKRGKMLVESRSLRKIAIVPLFILLCLGILFICYETLAFSGLFRIASIDIDGCKRLKNEEILGLSGVNVQSNLIEISKKQIEDRIERHRWVKGVKVTRKWPDRLLISVQEREPVAMINLNDGLRYIDKHGEIFASPTSGADLDYPVISGLTNLESSEKDDRSVLLEALLLIKYCKRDNPNLPAQNISEIRIDSDGLLMFLADRPFPVRLGSGDIWNKYVRLTKVLYWLYKRKEFARVSYIYADYAADRIMVGMEIG